MKRYLVTEMVNDCETVVGFYKSKAEAQKDLSADQWLYEVSGYWSSRPKMELQKLALTELAE